MARGTRTALERTGFDVCTGGCTGARAIVVGSAIALREPIELAELRRRRSLFVTPQSYRFSGTAHRSLLACAEVRDMPFADDAFDVIVDIGTLYHIARPDR